MEDKFLVNQRVRELMEALNFPENVDGFYKKFIGDSSSERLRLVFLDRHPIKIEFLLEIAKNIGEKTGKKINGHWLLTGEGEMFLDEKGTPAIKSDQAGVREVLENTIGILRGENMKLLNIVELAMKRGGPDSAQ